jgi:hypothetical protein
MFRLALAKKIFQSFVVISLNPLHIQHVQAFAKTFYTSEMFCEREKETQTQTDI